MRKLLIYNVLWLLLLSSCVQTPDSSGPLIWNTEEGSLSNIPEQGAMVLCEGLQGYNNTDITMVDRNSGKVIQSYFKEQTGSYIGDTGSDILINSNWNTYITLTGNHRIFSFNLKYNRINNAATIKDNKAAPRNMAEYKSNFYFTDLIRDKAVSFIDSADSIKFGKNYKTGPAPEDMIIIGNYMFIANSGFGDYRQDEPNAGTLQRINLQTGESKFLEIGPNVTELVYFSRSEMIAAGYRNTPSNVNSGEDGGIVLVDLLSFEEIDEKEVSHLNSIAAINGENELFFTTDKGLFLVRLYDNNLSADLVLQNNSNDQWYSLSYNKYENEIWIGNAKDYQTNGEIIVINANTLDEKRRFETGINPNKVVFYNLK